MPWSPHEQLLIVGQPSAGRVSGGAPHVTQSLGSRERLPRSQTSNWCIIHPGCIRLHPRGQGGGRARGGHLSPAPTCSSCIAPRMPPSGSSWQKPAPCQPVVTFSPSCKTGTGHESTPCRACAATCGMHIVWQQRTAARFSKQGMAPQQHEPRLRQRHAGQVGGAVGRRLVRRRQRAQHAQPPRLGAVQCCRCAACEQGGVRQQGVSRHG